MRAKTFLLAGFFVWVSTPLLFASLVGALDEISNQIDAGSSSGNPAPPAVNPPAAVPYPGTPLNSTTDPVTGNTSATYKNPDGSYTVRETDASGRVISQKSFGGPNVNKPIPGLNASESSMIQIAPDGSVNAGKLSEGSARDTVTGTTVAVQGNADGTRTVTTTDANGKVLSKENRGKEPNGGSAYDASTGKTTTSTANGDGTRTVTTTDKNGNVISQERRGKQPAGASSYDPATGITTSSVRQADGSRLVTQTDASGKVLSQEVRR